MKLQGVRVVDLSMFLPGPHVTMMMADHGAEVIKVEPPGEGEPNRHLGAKQGGFSIFFRNTHRGKRSLCLNLKSPAGREALLKLCETADVFVEAFRPGVVDRLGVGYRDVAARNPRIVYCSIAAFGQTGPYRDLPAHDLATEALAGVVSLNLGNDGEPTMPHVPAADMAASLLAFGGIMMALYRREQTGRGDYLDMAMHDSILAWTPNIVGEVFANRRPPVVKQERSLGGSAMYNIYRTRDGRHVVLGAQEIKFARNLLEALGRPEFLPLCERGPGAHQQPMIDFLRSTFAQKTQAEWVEWFAGRDIGFAPVKNLREAFDDPHAQARGMRLLDDQGQEHIGVPIRFAAEPAQPRFDLPRLGADNERILAELGYTAADIARMRSEGAIAAD
ncbi:MAG: CaiB/BaiF CoA-transferase family protein [Steroidobacteraceae bacterium]|nr:CoA transferase [Nevskiaceae bacterium]MCP5338944.1 CoA transferase [Nevskiaceae bacterium]MCP5359643.1 CoA transferase [Nevskiaceae bacterium]MCP5472563.1 CoA transferase [Nevskiaceae bacterium]